MTTSVNEDGKQTVEVVHEALIREWGRFREWMNADREFRVWQEKLRYALVEWDKNKKEESLLLRGSSLSVAEDWYKRRGEELSARKKEFIELSIRAREEAKQRELESEKKKKRLPQIIAIGSTFAAIFALGLNYFAYTKMKEVEANNPKSESLLLRNNLKDKINFLQDYFELVRANVERLGFKKEFFIHKMTLVSNLCEYIFTHPKEILSL